MRIKIGVLLPNTSKELIQTFSEVAAELDVDIFFAEGGFERAVEGATSLLNQHPDIICIFSRINSAVLLREHFSLPIIDLKLSHFDFVKTILKHSKTNKQPLLLFQFFGSRRLYDTNALSEVCGVRVETYMTKMRLNYDYAKVARALGFNRVITSIAAVADSCHRDGLDLVLVPFTKDNLISTFKYGIGEGLKHKQNNDQLRRMKESLNTFPDGLIATDTEGHISICNRSMCKILNISSNSILGTPVKEATAKFPFLKTVLSSNDEDIIEYLDSQYQVSSLSVPVPELINTIRSVTNIPLLQEKESAIRRKQQASNNFTAPSTFHDIVSNNHAMKALCQEAARYAANESNVLITGESGTGKEMLAQSIHNASPFCDGPFVAINCAALPESLLESELFGYEEGAFTGARRGGKSGLFELSQRGTLFLDEIGLLPLSLQAKLLRVIQEKQICRVGGTRLIPIYNRLICATNEDLVSQVQKGEFRADLFYRIDVLQLHLPPLRDRGDDIIGLAKLFIQKRCSKTNRSVTIQDGCLNLLLNYSWPGNIRQLQAFVERILAYCENNVIDKALLLHLMRTLPVSPHTSVVPDTSSYMLSDKMSIKDSEAQLIREAYEKYNGNRANICKELGISRTTLWKKLKILNIC
jgi:transcriptional regulator with PAS, ATPase and Fis domain